MLHGADYLARLMLCHFAFFNNQSNKIRVYRAILLPCYSLNLPRVSPGWCKSGFFSVWCNQLEAMRSKCGATLQSYHTIQLLFYFFSLPLIFFSLNTLYSKLLVFLSLQQKVVALRGTGWERALLHKADIKPEVHSHKPRALFPLLSCCIT